MLTATNSPDGDAGEQPIALASDLASFCKASADPLRLQVLRVLREDSFGVSELCAIFDIRQPALSHHLKVLAGASLAATRREGNSIFYRRAQLGQRPELEQLQRALFHSVDQIQLPAETELALEALHRQREENSRNFFRDNAAPDAQRRRCRRAVPTRRYAPPAAAASAPPGRGEHRPGCAAGNRRCVHWSSRS